MNIPRVRHPTSAHGIAGRHKVGRDTINYKLLFTPDVLSFFLCIFVAFNPPMYRTRSYNHLRLFASFRATNALQPALEEAAIIVARLLTQTSGVLERSQGTVVGGVDGEVIEPEKSSTLALEDVGDPAEGVVEVPESDADTGRGLGTATNGLELILVLLVKLWYGSKGNFHLQPCSRASATRGWSRSAGAEYGRQAQLVQPQHQSRRKSQ